MAIKNQSQLLSDANSFLGDNTTRLISPQDVRDRIKDLADSSINRIDDKPLLNLRTYNTGRVYELGEHCEYLLTLYKCIVATTTGTFNPLHWVAIIGPESLALTQLSDVTITSPTNGQVLQYNGTAWVNQNPTSTGWNLNGNTITSKKTLGSIDNFDIGFITNNVERLTITNSGKVSIVNHLSDTSFVNSIDLNNRTLKNSIGNINVDWENAALRINGSAVKRVDWDLNRLNNSAGLMAVDWENFQLVQGGTTLLNWNSGILVGASNNVSLHWYNRTLHDNTGTAFVYWANGNVGIGDSLPSPKLSVIGNGTTSSTYTAKFHNSTGTNNALTIRDDGLVSMKSLQIGNAGLVSGDLYKDTAANILSAGDYVVGMKA